MMANEHTKTLLEWDILVPSPEILTLIFCTGVPLLFFSYNMRGNYIKLLQCGYFG